MCLCALVCWSAGQNYVILKHNVVVDGLLLFLYDIGNRFDR